MTGVGRAARALGVDAAGKHGWVGVVVDADGFAGACTGSLLEILDGAGDVAAIGVDIPIGDGPGRHLVDTAARKVLGPRAPSVFSPPPLWALDHGDHAAANLALVAEGRPRVSRQAWNLLPKMREAFDLAERDGRVHEVHPEVSFRMMAADPLAWPKLSWNGLRQRQALLAGEGIVLSDELKAIGTVAADDLLDAAAVAWSARRIASGDARSLTDPPQRHDGRDVAIWY